jgi:hypothetical protein
MLILVKLFKGAHNICQGAGALLATSLLDSLTFVSEKWAGLYVWPAWNTPYVGTWVNIIHYICNHREPQIAMCVVYIIMMRPLKGGGGGGGGGE